MIVTATELRRKTTQVLKKVQQLGSATVTLRGRPVATLNALEKKASRPLTDYPAYGMWARRRNMADVDGWLRTIRTSETPLVFDGGFCRRTAPLKVLPAQDT